MNSRLDCALVELDVAPTPADASFRNGDRLAGVRSIDPTLAGKQCFFRSAAHRDPVMRTVRIVSASARVPLPNGAAFTQMSGLVAIDGPTTRETRAPSCTTAAFSPSAPSSGFWRPQLLRPLRLQLCSR